MIKPILTNESVEHLEIINSAVERTDDLTVLQAAANDLIETAESVADRCAGLSANQIGLNCHIFVVKTAEGYVPIANAKVIMASGKKSDFEGCLSRPNDDPIVARRSKEIVIEYLDIYDGERKRLMLNGFSARVVQHELMHLNGRANYKLSKTVKL